MEYDTATRMIELLLHTMRWMDLINIMLKERRQTKEYIMTTNC